jgi:hypothetical protein
VWGAVFAGMFGQQLLQAASVSVGQLNAYGCAMIGMLHASLW